MPKMTTKYQYRCPFTGCKNNYCSESELSDYPQCNTSHEKVMDFIEGESTGVPNHILESGQKSVAPGTGLKGGGNWIRSYS